MAEKIVVGKIFGYGPRETPDSRIIRLTDAFSNDNGINPVYSVLSSNQTSRTYDGRREVLGDYKSALEDITNYLTKKEIVIIVPESKKEEIEALLDLKGIYHDYAHLSSEEIDGLIQKINKQKPLDTDLQIAKRNFYALFKE